MKFTPHPDYFNRTGHYVSGIYAIHNVAPRVWELHIDGVLFATYDSMALARSAAETHKGKR